MVNMSWSSSWISYKPSWFYHIWANSIYSNISFNNMRLYSFLKFVSAQRLWVNGEHKGKQYKNNSWNPVLFSLYLVWHEWPQVSFCGFNVKYSCSTYRLIWSSCILPRARVVLSTIHNPWTFYVITISGNNKTKQ